MRLLSIVGIILLLSSCSDSENTIKDLRGDDPIVEQEKSIENTVIEEGDGRSFPAEEIKSNPSPEWSYEVTFLSENNWGYQLFQKGKMLINQTSIPSIQGVAGFDSAEKAERTAKHILDKLENGIFPPTVSKEELDSLNVLRD